MRTPLWHAFVRTLSRKLHASEDPEALLFEARREMTETHARNRERAVHAITARNNLQQVVDGTKMRTASLQAQAELALKGGDMEKGRQLLEESRKFETTLAATEASLTEAAAAADALQNAVTREEEALRQLTAEALALEAQWKSLQMRRGDERLSPEERKTAFLVLAAAGVAGAALLRAGRKHRRRAWA